MIGEANEKEPETGAERQIELLVSKVLRFGVTLASGVVLLGGIAFLSLHGRETVNYHVFRPAPPPDRSFVGVFQGLVRLSGRTVIQLGVVMLILTPVARVAIAMVGFLKAKDRAYAAISGIVLVVLLFGLSSGFLAR